MTRLVTPVTCRVLPHLLTRVIRLHGRRRMKCLSKSFLCKYFGVRHRVQLTFVPYSINPWSTSESSNQDQRVLWKSQHRAPTTFPIFHVDTHHSVQPFSWTFWVFYAYCTTLTPAEMFFKESLGNNIWFDLIRYIRHLSMSRVWSLCTKEWMNMR